MGRVLGKKSERGQAALLGVVALIILAIGMYTTYSFSRAVYEKIKLQNAADAAAYSLATTEARTFNFIAFSNRAMVANYMRIMEMETELSQLLAEQAFLGVWGERIRPATAIGRALRPDLARLGEILIRAAQALEPTIALRQRLLGPRVALETSKSQALLVAGLMLSFATTAQLMDGASGIVEANDSNARSPTAFGAILNLLNTASFISAFDFSAMKLWSDHEGTDAKEARRMMTELVNATRYGGVEEAAYFVKRRPMGTIQAILSGISFGGSAGRRLGQLQAQAASFAYDGSSKLLDAQDGYLRDPERTMDLVTQTRADASDFSPGDAMVAHDKYPLVTRTGVVLGRDGGVICRWRKGRNLWILRTGVRCPDSEISAWRSLLGKGGIQPFLRYAHRENWVSSEGKNFNQPDVWIWLNKPPQTMLHGQDLDFEIDRGREKPRLNSKIGDDNVLLPDGMNAVARAQVYYHRPGAWREPPNFFNPYWGARLAPKSAMVDKVLGEIALPGYLSEFISDNFWLH